MPLSGRADDAAAARRVVAEVATRCRTPVDLDDAILLADELVTNAVRHAGGATALLVCGTPSWLRVEVTDSSPVPPALTEPRPGHDRGRGLLLVERLSSAWGTQLLPPGGKVVWFEMRARPEVRP